MGLCGSHHRSFIEVDEDLVMHTMKLPRFEDVVVPRRKIVDYLLSFTHRDGRAKAQFFSQFGFMAENWEEMVVALKQHVEEHDVAWTEASPFGTRYIVEGEPRFVTAYPRMRR